MYSKELIQKIHRELPEELLDAIASEKTLECIESIASKNQLSVEQMHKLSSVLTWKLMGLVNESDFPLRLEGELDISSDLATKITDDISKNILSEIPSEVLQKQVEDIKKISELSSKDEPVVITNQETKEEAMKRLMERREQTGQKISAPSLIVENSGKVIETTQEIHPMIEKGEAAHEVPHIEEPEKLVSEPTLQNPGPTIPLENNASETSKTEAPPSGPKYAGGKDPYREPLE